MTRLLPFVALSVALLVTNLHVSLHAETPEAEVVRLSEPVAEDESSETFGEAFDTTRTTLSLPELVSNAPHYVDQPVLVETTVAKVCQKKGCFFIAQQGATALRVSFKDYGFFVPTDIGGKQVTLAGALVQVQRSPEIAAHYAEDAGFPVVQSGDVYEIVATGVKVPKS